MNQLDLRPWQAELGRPAELVQRDLESFAALLTKWNATQNLVSRETLVQLWARHVLDSLQLLSWIGRPALVLDLGSGGGLPGLPLAIALKETGTSLHLVEPIGKKVAFLRTVARELSLDVVVHGCRTKDLPAFQPDIITSRALADLSALLEMAAPMFSRETRALLHKGRDHRAEIDKAADAWVFDVLIHPSVTDASAAILEIANLSPRVR